MNGIGFLAAKVAETEVPNWLVVVMGMGIVFVALIALVLICTLFGAIFRRVNAKKQAAAAQTAVQTETPAEVIPNRQELVAAIAAVLAEELGTDVAKLRILSIRRR